jgi:hypothetical protein
MNPDDAFITQDNGANNNQAFQELNGERTKTDLMYKFLLPVALIISFSLAIIFGYQNLELRQQVSSINYNESQLIDETPLQVANELPAQPTPPPEEADQWLSYSYPGIQMENDFWKGYTIYFPTDWVVEVSENPQKTNSSFSITSRYNDVLGIGQNERGIGTCVYPDDARFDSDAIGMYSRMASYIEIKHNSGEVWRLSKPSEKIGNVDYIVCAPKIISGEYADATPIGLIYVTVSSQDSLDVVKKIIQRATIR